MKTAVEWLVNQMKQRESQGLTLSMYELEMFAEQAKEMEKEQIMQAFGNGKINGDKNWAHRYYNETFKPEE
jgi:hypothetical protein